jgi:hypothetical protein
MQASIVAGAGLSPFTRNVLLVLLVRTRSMVSLATLLLLHESLCSVNTLILGCIKLIIEAEVAISLFLLLPSTLDFEVWYVSCQSIRAAPSSKDTKIKNTKLTSAPLVRIDPFFFSEAEKG